MTKIAGMNKHDEFMKWYNDTLIEVAILPDKKPKYIHSNKERICLKTCCVIGCFPCCCYSTIMRLLMCPCTCGGSLGGTSCSKASDDCMINCCTEIDKKKEVDAISGLEWVAGACGSGLDEEKDNVDIKMICEKVNHILLEFKKKYLADGIGIFDKYKMVDWMQLQLTILGYKTSSGQSYKMALTPLNVCDVINDIIGNNSAMIHT